MVSAKRECVSELLRDAERWLSFCRSHGIRVSDEQDVATVRIRLVIDTSAGLQVTVDQADLTCIHDMSRAFRRATCSRIRKLWQTHCVASYLIVFTLPFSGPEALAAPLLTGWFLFVYLPVAGPWYWLTRPRGEFEGLLLFISIEAGIRYATMLPWAWYIARHLRSRQPAFFAYLGAVMTILCWWVFYFLRW